ncbi:PREDICTED: nibrin [Polistes dominula]|uniref:Nibrin n=1 Tax=Polistes dominula TaxID=743375 RepID=A0ABM1I5R0_POLDO|nr:PREDICTED: nibrin [Polistes dominula]
MWLLETAKGKLIYLKPNIPLTIGRTKGDIVLSHDASISKFHASFVVKTEIQIVNDKATTLCILKDEGSKYGTYILKDDEYEKISTNVHLKDQDSIRIGLQYEIFTVKYIPMITLTSGLEETGKKKLEKIMKQIDGIILNNWQQHCTHLTALCPKLTEKVAIALAAGIVIVTIDYWEAVKFAMENDEHPIPKPDNYIPRIKEEYIPRGIVSLYPNDKRKKLFNRKSFYFYDLNQYEMYKLMIKLADGKAFFIDLEINQDLEFGEHAFHVQINKDSEDAILSRNFKRHHDNIFWMLKRKKQRFIHDSEIPLAILYCSIEKYCNPKYQFSNIFKKEKKLDFFLPETLVMDTQDLEMMSAPTQRSFYTKQKDDKKSSKFVDNIDRYTEISATEKSDDEISEILLSDDEEVSIITVQPTTSLSSVLPKFTESEESSSSDLFIDHVEVGEIASSEEEDTSTAKESQSFVGQKETKITENLSTIKISSNKCLQNENTTESDITSNIFIRKRPVGKTFQKAHVKIPEKRLRF